MKVALFIPCYVDRFAPQIGIATARILRRLDVDIHFPPRQTCCGQPAFNAGYTSEARAVAETFISAFGDAETVVGPSGSCVAMVKHRYPTLFEGRRLAEDAAALGERMYELSQFLVDVLGVDRLGAEFHGRAVFHDSCHALRELGIRDQPRRLLAHVSGLELTEMDAHDSCCGFGGLFSSKFSALSTAIADEKLQTALDCRAEYIIAGEASCLMHLSGRSKRRRLPIRGVHLAEVLAAREAAG
jgi:L-lactate dehydrogenase complex protein LldE